MLLFLGYRKVPRYHSNGCAECVTCSGVTAALKEWKGVRQKFLSEPWRHTASDMTEIGHRRSTNKLTDDVDNE